MFAVRLDPKLENPVGGQIQRDCEGQANSEEQAVAQDIWDRKECYRRGLGTEGKAGMIGDIYGLRCNDKAQSREGQDNLQMGIAAQQGARNKVVTGALLRIAKNCGVKNNRATPKASAARHHADIAQVGTVD